MKSPRHEQIRREFADGSLSSQLVMSITMGLVIVDPDGTHIFWNKASEEILGGIHAKITTAQWSLNYGLFEADGTTLALEDNLPLVRALRYGETVLRRELFLKNSANPRGIYIKVNAFPLKNAAGEQIGAFATFADVTSERDMAQQLQQAQKMEAIGQLAGGIAHDFNNKLAAMTFALSELKKRCVCCDEENSELAIMKKLVTQSASLTNKILAFSRRQTLSPETFDLNAFVSLEMPLLIRMMGSEVEVVSRLAAREANVYVDKVQFEQVLFNLAVNARDAMPGGGTLIIETDTVRLDSDEISNVIDVPPGFYCVLTVSDTGVGIRREILDRIMEPFFTTKPQGTGLGLSTVQGIVKQSNGFFRVYSELGKGATFRVYLPLSLEPPSEGGVGGECRLPSENNKKLKVLLVEDEETLLALTSRVLRSLGHEVYAMSSAQAASDFIESSPCVDLLITDTVMPGLSPKQLEKKVRGRFPNLKTIYMSGHSHEVITRKGILETGINFLQKPFSVESLDRLIKMLFAEE